MLGCLLLLLLLFSAELVALEDSGGCGCGCAPKVEADVRGEVWSAEEGPNDGCREVASEAD
jgi:hypothetical protein